MTCEEALCTHAMLLQSCSTLCDPMNCSPPGSSVHGFSRQEYWTGLPCLPPGDLPDPGIEPLSSVAPALKVNSLLLSHRGSPCDALLNPIFRDFYLFILAAISFFIYLSCGMWDLFSCSMWDLVPGPGIKPRPPAFGAWGLSHWTT